MTKYDKYLQFYTKVISTKALFFFVNDSAQTLATLSFSIDSYKSHT
jgi:hypothetical protein